MVARSLCSEAPLCLDGEEAALSNVVVSIHDGIVAKRGFAPELSVERQNEIASRVASVISSVFCTVYGVGPEQRYADIFEQVTVFAVHLVKDHIFPDGNKCTMLVSSLSILQLTGFTLDFEDTDEPAYNGLYVWVLNAAAHGKSNDELAAIMRDHKQEIASVRLS